MTLSPSVFANATSAARIWNPARPAGRSEHLSRSCYDFNGGCPATPYCQRQRKPPVGQPSLFCTNPRGAAPFLPGRWIRPSELEPKGLLSQNGAGIAAEALGGCALEAVASADAEFAGI